MPMIPPMPAPLNNSDDRPDNQPGQPDPQDGRDARSSDLPPRATWGGRIFLGLLAVLLVLNLGWMFYACQERPSARGHAAPDFQVRRLDGGTFKLSESLGHPVLVDFWATWCVPCRQSLPILDQVYASYKDRGLRAIAIETDGAAGPAQTFIRQLGLKLPIGLGDDEVSRAYEIQSIPHLLLINGKGDIVRIFHGVHAADELGRAVESAGLPPP